MLWNTRWSKHSKDSPGTHLCAGQSTTLSRRQYTQIPSEDFAFKLVSCLAELVVGCGAVLVSRNRFICPLSASYMFALCSNTTWKGSSEIMAS
jgi:hypothetical protein